MEKHEGKVKKTCHSFTEKHATSIRHQSVTFYMNLPNLKGQKVKLRTIKQMTLKVTYAAFNQSHCGFDF